MLSLHVKVRPGTIRLSLRKARPTPVAKQVSVSNEAVTTESRPSGKTDLNAFPRSNAKRAWVSQTYPDCVLAVNIIKQK